VLPYGWDPPGQTNPAMRKKKMLKWESAAVSIFGPSLVKFPRRRILEPLQRVAEESAASMKLVVEELATTSEARIGWSHLD
jgi:hypothetical protein